MAIVIPYLEKSQPKVLKTSIDVVSFVRLISNMHQSFVFNELIHSICIFYLLTSAKFNIYDVIEIYDVIALMNKCKIGKIVVFIASTYSYDYFRVHIY